jgi:molybdenum cofactor cytidylyltransferase
VPLRRPREGGDQLPMVVHAARNLRQGAGNALAVIPRGATELRRILEDAGCEILESDDTRRGLGASLAAGVAHVPGASGWIVALGDMPFVRAATIASVRSALEGGAVVAAPVLTATGVRGHPVGFSGALKDELLVCDGDEGARSVIERHRAALVSVAVDDRGIVIDIDTPEDLDAATAL